MLYNVEEDYDSRNGKNVEERCCSIFKVLPEHFLEGLRGKSPLSG
jgi:hypothetical protein